MLELDLTGEHFKDKILGCWVGKNCGGTLGTPVEKAWGEPDPFDIWWYPELQEGGLPNDDLEMQLVWLVALEQVGPGLTARELSRYWLDHIGYNFDEYGLSKTNLRLGLEPPVSGHFNNWFIDCMGCPIRSEIWACVAPGNPRLAAQYAFQDAICDHAGGESVYGELFNVSIQSAGFVVSDRQRLLDIGLSYVPAESSTARAVRAAREAHAEGLDWKQARERVLAATPHHVAQFSPINMGFQVIGFLYGEDFGDAMCKTVNCGYDTDSSGGSIGSWLGITAGRAALPDKWIEPFGDAISTNESWGGVRHLTDGTTPVPTDLPHLAERIVAAATRVLRAHGRIDPAGVTRIEDSELFADESVQALWHRNPMVVSHPAVGLRVEVDYGTSPAADPDSVRELRTRVINRHPDPIRVRAEIVVPAGWTAPAAQEIEVPAQSESTVDWELAVPGRALLENSNRLFLTLRAAGQPQEPAVPIVLIGANVLQVAGPYPVEGADALGSAELLARPFAPETGDVPWTDHSAAGNALPVGELLAEPGVLYLRTYLHCAQPRTAELGAQSSHPVKVWLNGQPVIEKSEHGPIRPSYGGPRIELAAGWNELRLKIVRTADTPPPQCHVLLCSADRLRNGLPDIGRTRRPGDDG